MIRSARSQRRLRPGLCRCGARMFELLTTRRTRPDGRQEKVETRVFMCGHRRQRSLGLLPKHSVPRETPIL